MTIAPAAPETPAAPPGGGDVVPSRLGAWRHYRGQGRTVAMPSVTSVRDAARGGGPVTVPVRALVDGAVVSGSVEVSHVGGVAYEVGESRADPLVCDRDGGHCPHVDEVCESTRALLEARQVRTGLQGLARATSADAGVLAAEHSASLAAQEQAAAAAEAATAGGSSWAEDPAAFQAEYRAARRRRARGEAPVPYLTDNATGGLGARAAGRSFGAEIEFEMPDANKAQALQAIADDLHAEGLLRRPVQEEYHASSDYTRWRFEKDPTVTGGEIITPIMYDEPGRWAELAKVCEIVRRHGGEAKTGIPGCHVHVGVADYDHTVENHRRLLGSFHEHEDTLFRLAHNPDRARHRELTWCRPNLAAQNMYSGRAGDVAGFAAGHSSHHFAMNYEAAGSGSAGDHVEFRMWDSSLDPGVIQTQIKMSLGMTQDAFARPEPPGPRLALGTHRNTNGGQPRGARLRGEAWRNDTAGFRGLVDRVFHRDADKAQAAALFAVTKWQHR